MDHLSKQQLILLALLVSFVTSLATGIFTVSLMSQAPKGVIQTINQVVEKTIQVASTPSANFGTVAITVNDQVSTAVSAVSPSVVRLFTRDGGTFLGLGLIVSDQGIIMADKSISAQINGVTATFFDGNHINLIFASTQPSALVTYLAPDPSNVATETYAPASLSGGGHLGQTVLSLAGTSTPNLAQGIILESVVPVATSTDIYTAHINTSIDAANVVPGSPLFTPSGDVIGFKLTGTASFAGTAFYPISLLKSTIPTGR